MARPSKQYAIETRYVGEGLTPWEGWKVTRYYQCAEDRDEDFQRLQLTVEPFVPWRYRIRRPDARRG